MMNIKNFFSSIFENRFFNFRIYSLFAVVVAAGLGVLLACSAQPAANSAGLQRVTGTLVVAISTQLPNGNPSIELPDAKIFLRDSSTQKSVATAITHLDGKFHLSAPPGIYDLCWKTEGLEGCRSKIDVRNAPVYLGIVYARTEGPLIYGKVLTADNRACWVADPFFKLDVSTAIQIIDHSGNLLRKGIRANTEGEYVSAGMAAGRYVVEANCEKAAAKQSVSVGGTAAEANLTLPNHAPAIVGLSAFDSGKGITRAAPGATVKVNVAARDADQDPVEFVWGVQEGYGTLAGPHLAQQQWTVPTAPGLYSLYLVARDGKGGYAYRRFDLQVGATDVSFSGRVIDEVTQAPVANAVVNVNGTTTNTNAAGWFDLRVAIGNYPERYAVNISHPQYALLSRIFDKDGSGNTFELIRVQTRTFDPSKIIDTVDTDSSGPCGTPGGRRDVGAAVELQAASRTQPNVETKPCEHRGAQISLPAGALVDADKKPAQGPITLAFATLNPSRRSLPGDYRAVDRSNTQTELLSFGALYAEFRDSSNKPVNLKAGSKAEIRVPVAAGQLAMAKPTIAIWSFDERNGLWKEEGKAALKNTPRGWMYIGNTTHFSTLNMDVAGNDINLATCVKFTLGTPTNFVGWSDLHVRAYVSYIGSTIPQVKETAVDGAQYHAIFRIPYVDAVATPHFPHNTLRLELRGKHSGQEVVLLNKIIDTDARPKMTNNGTPTALWPNYPYDECGDAIELAPDVPELPYYGDNDATGRPYFLTGPYGEFLPPDAETEATDYYTTIGAIPAKDNLGKWWGLNGFDPNTGSGGVASAHAAYLNFNDLGFGRDMTCRPSGSDLACYVTNYGAPDQNLNNAHAAFIRDLSKRGATVAMEYKASEPAEHRVRFYVYGGGDKNAPIAKFADLDGLGPKPVPHLCTVCHGGGFDTASKNALNSRFREFDLPSFKYDGGVGWDFTQAEPYSGSFTAFAALNKMVHDIAPGTSPIGSLISNWYTGGYGPNTAPIKPAVPSGWSTQVNGYHNVYAKSCRTCHIARDAGVANNFLTFNSSADFTASFVSDLVCGPLGPPYASTPKKMPNAYVTYRNFWSDLTRVIDYRALAGRTAANCQ